MYPDVFAGGYGPGYRPEAFMAWADSIDNFILQKQVPSQESLSFAISLLRGEAKAWWREEEVARWYEEEQLETWDELKIVMSFKYIPGLQWEEEEPDFDSVLEGVEQALFMTAAEHEVETQGLCLHVPDQTKQEEKVFVESTTILELAPALIDQGESFKSLSCGSLTWFTLEFKSSLVEHLRIAKGLQQVVFEPGGSLSVSRRSNNNLAQKTVSYKLDLQGFFTPEEQDLRSNLFEGREDGVILSSCCEKRRESGGNTFLIRFIIDQNQLRRVRQECVVFKQKPKFALSSVCNEIHLRHVRGFQHFVFKPTEEVCVCKNRNQIVIERSRSLELIEKGSRSLRRNGKGLQCWVFDPGDDHSSILLQDLDLRTNPFEGREYGVILSRLKIKAWDPMYWPANLLIKAWLNGQFQSLTGMIYEVLDREKRRCFGTTRNGEVSDGKLKLFKLDESRSDAELDESEENELIEPEQGDKGAFRGTINNPEKIRNIHELNLSYGDQFTRLSGPLEQGKQLRKVLGWARI